MKEADFYSPGEVAKALGIPERRVFGMLCSGELQGQQDRWARWWVPASALWRAQRGAEASLNPGSPREDGVGSRTAGNESPGDAAATTARLDRTLLRKPPDIADVPSSEETTQEVDKVPVRSRPASYIGTKSSDAETTQKLPQQVQLTPYVVSEETIRELTERLASAAAKVGELEARLELADATEKMLRESLERERQRADRERARAQRERRAITRLAKELRAERNKEPGRHH
jgi:hypothetical protein